MKSFRRRACLAGLGVITAVAALAGQGSAARASTLSGDWAPFTRCPVNASSMLAADGVNTFDECAATASASGSITLGSVTVPLGNSDLQIGVLADNSTFPATTAPIAPSGGAIAAAPVTIPGGLLGLMCPSSIPGVTQLCDEITSDALNAVTATIEPAGNPSNLNLGASFGQGQPILTIPVKIQLSNPILGSNCFIGSSSDPIVLNPQNSVAPPNGTFDTFDANGTSDPNGVLDVSTLSGGTMIDKTFAVPDANGCGPLGVADLGVDLKEGLPSSSGHNSLTLNNPVTSLAGYNDPTSVAPNEGKDFAAAWTSAGG